MLMYAEPFPPVCPLPTSCHWSLLFFPGCRTLLPSFRPVRFSAPSTGDMFASIKPLASVNDLPFLPLFSLLFCAIYVSSPLRGQKSQQGDTGVSRIPFSLPVLFTLIFPDAGTWGVHLVSLAISSFIDCVWAERYLLTLWSNLNTFLPDEICHQTNPLSKFPCRGTYPWTWPSVTHNPGISPARKIYS